MNRGSGRGRVHRAICPADHLMPTVESSTCVRIADRHVLGTAGRFDHGGTGLADGGHPWHRKADPARQPFPARARPTGPRCGGTVAAADGRARRRPRPHPRPRRPPPRHGLRGRSSRHRRHQPRGRRRSAPARSARRRGPQLCRDRRVGDPAARAGPGPRPLRGPGRRPAADHRAGPDRVRRLCEGPGRLLARGAGAGRDLRDLHRHRPFPPPRRRPRAGDRHRGAGRAAPGRRGGGRAGAGRRDRSGGRCPRHRAAERPPRRRLRGTTAFRVRRSADRPAHRERGHGPRVRGRPESRGSAGADGHVGGGGRSGGRVGGGSAGGGRGAGGGGGLW